MTPNRRNVAVAFYGASWGGTPEGLQANGYEPVNVSWRPLYVLPGSRLKACRRGKRILDEFRPGRFGAEGAFGEPMANARDRSRWQDSVVGAPAAR